MPKLIYFHLQGRGQAIRFLLNSKGVQFEDERISFEEWGAAKAAKTHGEMLLPIWVRDDGVKINESVAILKMLAMEHGYACENASVMYETEWFFGML